MTATKEAPAIHTRETERDRDMKMVKGRFRMFQPVGGSAKFPYRRHKGEPIKWYEFIDGQEYTIPYGLARHLREDCCYYEHGHIMDINGNPLVNKKHNRVDRMTFEPLGFGIDGEF